MNNAIKFSGNQDTLEAVLFCLRQAAGAQRIGDARAAGFKAMAQRIATGDLPEIPGMDAGIRAKAMAA